MSLPSCQVAGYGQFSSNRALSILYNYTHQRTFYPQLKITLWLAHNAQPWTMNDLMHQYSIVILS